MRRSSGVGRIGWRPLVVAAALVVGCAVAVTACQPPEPVAGTTTVEVAEGQDATVRSADGGLVVDLPGTSLTGEGRLSVRPATSAAGRRGWDVELDGAELTGRARLTFHGSHTKAGEPTPVVAYADSVDGPLRLATDVEATKAGVVVSTTHFSSWFVEGWESMFASARRGLDRIYAPTAMGKQPRCQEEKEVRAAGFRVSSDEGGRVLWCLGRAAGGSPTLRIVNGRGYTVSVESTPGATPGPAARDDLVTSIASLVKERPSQERNTVTLLPPGGQLDLTMSMSEPAGVKVLPSNAGYLVTSAQFAVDTLAMVLDRTGTSRSRAQIIKALRLESCLAGYSSMTTATIENAAEAGTYLNDALGTTLGCAQDALGRLDLGGPAAALAQGFTWLMSGLRTAANGLGAAADTALDPDGYQVTVRPPIPDSPAELAFTPGAYGPLEVGMDGDAAVATGLVERRSEPGCQGTIWMTPALESIHLDFDDRNDAVVVVGSYEPGPRTDRGIGVGSTYRQLLTAYGDQLSWEVNEYGQPVYLFGQGDRYLAFFFSDSDGPDVDPGDRVASILASAGDPVTTYEGEGPC